MRTTLLLAIPLLFASLSPAHAQSDTAAANVARFTGFVSIGPSLASIGHFDGTSTGSRVGTQFGVVSLSLELRVLFNQRFGLALTPLTWQPSGGVQDSGDHWRFVRIGGGLRVQALDPAARTELTFGYDLSYLRATDVEHCIDCGDFGERARTFTGSGHSFSARLDTPIVGALRIGARLEGGFSSDLTMSWLSLGVSLGFGQRAS